MGTLQARPGPRLRSRLARTSLRGGRAPGPLARPRWAGPAARGGGGDVLASPGVRAWLSAPPSPAPLPRAPPPAASGPAPARARRGPRCSLAGTGGLAPHPWPRLYPGAGGEGRPAGPPRGGEGGGWWPPALRPGRARGAAVSHSASPIRNPALFLPPVARAGRCPHVTGPQRHWQRHRQAAERAQVVAFASSRMLSAAPCVGAAVRPWKRRTALLGEPSDWASRVLLGRP